VNTLQRSIPVTIKVNTTEREALLRLAEQQHESVSHTVRRLLWTAIDMPHSEKLG
jgi:hypothetical protein